MSRTTIIRFLNSLNKLADYVRNYRSKAKLPKYLHEVMIELLLSDASLERSSMTSAAHLYYLVLNMHHT